jgi:two-component system nitrate/nitrite response regulator NarL
MRILIADDSDVVRRGVIGILSAEPGWIICGEAKDGLEAVKKAQELVPDLILLDISMPGANGLEVTRRLRQHALQAKIVLISQHDPAQILQSALTSGADACVDKGRLVSDLVMTIKKLTSSLDILPNPAVA